MKIIILSSLFFAAALAEFVNIEPAIVGGTTAPAHAYPFMVSIHWVTLRPQVSSSHVCGGALLSRLWVLTAGREF
jgi:secreted trypsin-like serine protease